MKGESASISSKPKVSGRPGSSERPSGVFELEGAVHAPARDVELELDGDDRRLTRAGEALDLIGEHRARVELVLGVDDHDRLRMPAVADRDCDQRPAEKVALMIRIAGLPQAAGLLHAIAERVHDEHRDRHHEPVLGDADEVGAADALAARNAVHVEQEGVDPLHRRIGIEEGLRLVAGEPRSRHGAMPFAAAPKRRNSDVDTGFDLRCPLGVPLHAQAERRVVRSAHGLDQAILGEGLGLETIGEARDALPMQRVDHDLVAPDPVAQFAAQR